MTGNIKQKKTALLFVILPAAGALLAMCTHFFPASEAAYVICPWLYLPCFLYVSRHMTRPVHFVIWALCWCGSFMVRYRGILLPLGPGISMGVQFAAAVVYSLPFWLDRFACRRGCGVASLLVFPLAFASVDYILELTCAGSLFSLAQTQFDNRLLLQLASVLGCRGLVLVTTLWASFIVYCRKNIRGILICLAAVLALHICGLIRIGACAPTVQTADKVVVGWSAEPVIDDSFFAEGYGGDKDANVECLIRALSEARDKGVDLLCFPEEAFYISQEDHEEFIETARELAAQYRMNIMLPVESSDPDSGEEGINHCLMIGSDGVIQEDYIKSMLIPVAEKPYYVQGDGELPQVSVRIGGRDLKISYAICFDGDFASYVRTMPDDTDLFIDISWDWDAVDELHYRIIGLRAVENGLTVVKPTICGYTTVTDCLGSLRSKTHSDDTGYSGVNLVELPLAKCDTIYHRYGGLIDALYLIGMAVCLLLSVIRRGKSGKNSSNGNKCSGGE